ncbi:MAG: S1C family serine protease, partial [Patescibacteria group bacterium]|nr:S1C family serine protease [Patescibacteria group bacterium]
MNIFKTIFKSRERKLVSEVVVLSVIFGFAAGLVGQIFADVYINPWGETDLIQTTNTNQDLTYIPELKKVKRFLGIQQDFEVSKSVEQNAPSVVGIYLKKSTSKDYLNDIYLPQDLKGNAFILTTDGWMITHQSVMGNLKKEQLVVSYGGKIVTIDKLIIDRATGIAFIKAALDNLPVVVLGDSDEINYGQLVLILDAVDEVVVANVKSFNRNEAELVKNLIYSSEIYNDYLVLQDEVGGYFLGSPLINLGGEVVGVVSSIDQSNKLIKVIP